MKVTRKLIDAVGVMQAVGESPITVKDIAARMGTSTVALQQTTRRLRIAGLIKVKRGAGGGIMRHPDRPTCTLLDICQAVAIQGELAQDTGAASGLIKGLLGAAVVSG